MSSARVVLSSQDPREVLAHGYPARGAVDELHRRVRKLLTAGVYQRGDRFLTDEELSSTTGLSRSTVRRALGRLRDAGYLESRAGLGTFVGDVAMRGGGHDDPARRSVGRARARQGIRLGILAFGKPKDREDWLTLSMMRGLHIAAERCGATVEFVSGLKGSLLDEVDRIAGSGIDVVISLSADPADAMLLRALHDRGVKCLLAGTLFPDLPLPRVCEDNRGGMDMVVRQIAAQGHQRIGLLMRRWVGSWVFKRHEQWMDTLRALRLPADEGLMHWLPMSDERFIADDVYGSLMEWMTHARLDALIIGHWGAVHHLSHFRRSNTVDIPHGTALAMIDQYPEIRSMLGFTPDTAVVPLQQIGEVLVDHAVAWMDGDTPPSLTTLPMHWQPGDLPSVGSTS